MLSEMNLWTLSALLFCFTLIYSSWAIFRPELPHMSPVRKGILAASSFFLVVYGLLMIPIVPARMVGYWNLQTVPLLITLSLSSGASAAFIIEVIRAVFFRRATWQDNFHFMVVVVCWAMLFLVQSGLVIIGGGT